VERVSYPFPLEATIPELQAAMESGELTAVALVDFYLARIAAYDDAGPRLRAFILVNPSARDEAAALDAERARSGPRGPLHGIPVVIKDNIGTVDMPTTAGSFALEGFIPDKDAFQVQRLREAGAIILGKTNLYEFAQNWTTASSVGGQTLSPYDLGRDPGGSSGGSAVAVSANFAMLGWGTDTCGSVRYPAVMNDLYGLRPTEGLTSRSGVIPLSTTLDAMGPMARSVVDLAIALQATVGVDPADPTTVPVQASYVDAVDPDGLAGRRIGVVHSSLSREYTQLMAAAIEDMKANGAEVVEVTLPVATHVGWGFDEFPSALDAYFASQPSAPVQSFAELNAAYADHPELDVLHIHGWGPMISLDSSNYLNSMAARPVYRDAFVAFMDANNLDAVIYPESRAGAPLIGKVQEPFDCSLAPHGGFPAISVPIGFTSAGLPYGLELMGRPFAEETLLSLAAGYEAHTNHWLLPPTTPPL
jgi:Asp-tRNA(Asn)/Glu-tRNA(Gln) amidotransferase A subunit family amidase